MTQLKIPFSMGVGGSFDILAGELKRTPKLLQKMGLEWLYRIYQEPTRMFLRYAKTNPIFISLVFKEKMKYITLVLSARLTGLYSRKRAGSN